MKEIAEFRVPEEFAGELFAEDEGRQLRSIRKVDISTDDPRYPRIGEIDQVKKELGERFFYGWDIQRKYSKAELEAALLFTVRPQSTFQPAGEEHGTKYDESIACPECGTGATQVGPLILDVKRIPKRKDISRTIAGEIVVSRQTAEFFKQQEISGVTFGPVWRNRRGDVSEDWFQLIVQDTNAEIVAPTQVGINPFNEDPEGTCSCSKGDLIGLNKLSELTVRVPNLGETDVISTHQYIGCRRGLLRPQREILISPRVRELIESEKLKGFQIEVAHVL